MLRICFILVLGLLATATFLGCGETPRPAVEDTAATADGGETAESSVVQMNEAEIQVLAEKQKICAVTGEPLGSMGTPVPVRVTDSKGERHTVLLCCESCREELLEDPDRHLANLKTEEARSESSEGT